MSFWAFQCGLYFWVDRFWCVGSVWWAIFFVVYPSASSTPNKTNGVSPIDRCRGAWSTRCGSHVFWGWSQWADLNFNDNCSSAVAAVDAVFAIHVHDFRRMQVLRLDWCHVLLKWMKEGAVCISWYEQEPMVNVQCRKPLLFIGFPLATGDSALPICIGSYSSTRPNESCRNISMLEQVFPRNVTARKVAYSKKMLDILENESLWLRNI